MAKTNSIVWGIHAGRTGDDDELVTLILAHYEQFDSRYKALLPMKRVYVPEPLDETK